MMKWAWSQWKLRKRFISSLIRKFLIQCLSSCCSTHLLLKKVRFFTLISSFIQQPELVTERVFWSVETLQCQELNFLPHKPIYIYIYFSVPNIRGWDSCELLCLGWRDGYLIPNILTLRNTHIVRHINYFPDFYSYSRYIRLDYINWLLSA